MVVVYSCARSCPCKVVTNPILLSSQLTLTADLITEELCKLNSNTDKEPKKKKVKKLVSRRFDLFWLVFISAVCTISCAGCISFFFHGDGKCSFDRARKGEQDDENEGAVQLQRVTVVLELLQSKINIEEPHRLLPTLFGTLTRYMYSPVMRKKKGKNLVKLCNLKTTLLFKVNGKWKLALPYTFRWTYLMMETSKTSALRVAWIPAVLNFCMEVSRLMCLSINVNDRFFVHHTVNICSGWHQDFV